MANLFYDISSITTPNIDKVFEKITKNQKDRIIQKIYDFNNHKEIINNIEKTLNNITLDFSLSQEIFEKKYLILFNPLLKPKLTIEEQINKLKLRGVSFNIMTELDAKAFLTNNTFYYKLTAYRKNFEKNTQNKYIDLDFAYLVDLSIIDLHLSSEILKLCSCIEHAMKTFLLRDFVVTREDGYSIVNDFIKYDTQFDRYPLKKDRIRKLENKAIWHIAEEVTLGELFKLSDFFYRKHTRNNSSYKNIKSLSQCIITLRNDVSHNSCLIYNLKPEHIDYPVNKLTDYIWNTIYQKKFNRKTIRSLLKNRFIHNLLGSILALSYISGSKKIKYHRYKDFMILNRRILEHQEYYKNNKTILLAYKFMRDIINYFYKMSAKNLIRF